MNLDKFAVFTYAAGYSAFNPTEHLWSPISSKLAGVLFKATLEGESKAPSQQEIINKENVRKEKEVFDKALNELDQLLVNSQFDGVPVEVFKVMCDEDDLLWNDYGRVKNFLDCPLKSIHEYSDISKEYIKMFQHIDRYSNEIVFLKCSNKACCSV